MFVNLRGYQTAREIVEKDGRLYFEVAETGHYSICQSRIEFIREVVNRKKLPADYQYLNDRYPRDGRTLWVGLEKTKPEMSAEEIKDLFRENFELPII